MRKSEAELILDHLDDHYDGPLQLDVVNLRSMGYHMPPSEHPYFVVGYLTEQPESEPDDDSSPPEVETRHEVVVWDDQSSGWSVRHVQSWRVRSQQESEARFYVYDTRSCEFVPIPEFQLPSESY